MTQASYLSPLRLVADVLVAPSAFAAFKVDDRFACFDHIIQIFRRGNGDWHVGIDPIVATVEDFPENGACLIECHTLWGACDSASAIADAARKGGRSAAVIGYVPDHGAIERDQAMARGLT
jgi:hypothetical protein